MHRVLTALAALALAACTTTGMIAVYDNTLTGEWRFCFGGQRTDAGCAGDMKKCVYDADPTSADTYDPAKQ